MELLAPVLAAEGGAFNPLAFDPGAFLLTLITFLALFGLLLAFAWNPILNALDAREKRIGAAMNAAEEARREAEQLRQEVERRVTENEREIAARIDEGRQAAMRQAQEILDRARADADAERERALREIDTRRQQALAELRSESVRLANAIAEKILARELNEQDHRHLAEQVLAAMR